MKLTIAHWNILHDFHYPKNTKQAVRINHIVDAVNAIREKSPRFLLFLCELEQTSLKEIAKRTNLVVVSKPHKYTRLAKISGWKYASAHGIFLADKETAKKVKELTIPASSRPIYLIVAIEAYGKKIIGCHMPARPIIDTRGRYGHTSSILDFNPDIFMGDLNATPLFWMRKRFVSAGYKEVHIEARPPFPSPSFRGQNIRWWWPTMNIDAIYKRPEINSSKEGFTLNEGSDHPLIWAEFDLK